MLSQFIFRAIAIVIPTSPSPEFYTGFTLNSEGSLLTSKKRKTAKKREILIPLFPNLLVRSLLVSMLSCSSVSWWQHAFQIFQSSLHIFQKAALVRLAQLWESCCVSISFNIRTYLFTFSSVSGDDDPMYKDSGGGSSSH